MAEIAIKIMLQPSPGRICAGRNWPVPVLYQESRLDILRSLQYHIAVKKTPWIEKEATLCEKM